MFDKEGIESLILTNTRRLLKLKEQQAKFGLHAPPHILTEIEDVEAEIEKLNAQLDQVEVDSNPQSKIVNPKSKIENPFYTGGRINDPHYFFGRKRLIREVRSELKKRNNVSLVGESQMGKSSLLYYLYATRAEWLPGITLAYIDLQGVLDEEDFCETVLEKLGATGCTLRDLKRALLGREVVLLFDEMERLAEDDFSPRLHDLLRSLAQEPHFAMGLATGRPLIEVFPARTPGGVSPFHNIFTLKTIGPFTQTGARAFLTDRLINTGLTFTESEIDHLLAESECHPARLQARAKALFAEKAAL